MTSAAVAWLRQHGADYGLATERVASVGASAGGYLAAMLGRMAPAAVANAQREAADLQQVIDAEQAAKRQPSFQLEPWDWAFYSEKVRQERFNFAGGEDLRHEEERLWERFC